MSEKLEQSGSEAIRDALDIALERDQATYIIGEGVTDPKSIFGTTEGLLKKYGSSRVIETPVSENGFTGVAIGSALLGQRPIVIHQRVEFALLSMEQIINNAAKAHYISNGHHSMPLVIRLVIGRGWGQGPLHSQSLESLFSYIPGLKVVMPATVEDCKGMLLSAIEDENPVIFLEHRWVHFVKGVIPKGYAKTPLDGPKRLWEGDAATVVASSYMSLEALHAVKVIAEEGCDIDLFDLRVLRPLNLTGVFESVRRTGRLLVVDTGSKTLGPGAEIVAQSIEHCFDSFKRPPLRLGLPDHPTPSARSLVSTFYPRAEHIALAVSNLIEMPQSASRRIAEKLSYDRQSYPIDVPHPTFQGPF
jgi:acetoin:2,6-dichlorophenolindophenol oxidoreductase subunit beta